MTGAPGVTCDDVRELAAGYVLEALEPDVADAVRAHLRSCDEPHAEVVELGGVVPYLLASAEPIEPSSALRGRILGAAAEDEATPGRSRPSTPPEDRSRTAPAAPRRPWLRLGLVGAAIAIVALITTAGFLAVRLSQAEDYASALGRAAALAATPGSRAVTLAPTAGSGLEGVTGIAVVSPSRPGIVVVEGLTPTSGSEVYEAWVIGGRSSPVPAGSFEVGADRRGWVESVPVSRATGPLTIALTREAGPGATTPTLPILVAGATGA